MIDFLGSGVLRLEPTEDGISDDVKALRSEIKSIVRKYEKKSGTVCELAAERVRSEGFRGIITKLSAGNAFQIHLKKENDRQG